jgi:hypothetical protein
MNVDYKYIDDRRTKEGDLAREGYVYRFYFTTKDRDDLKHVYEWLDEHVRSEVNKMEMSSSGNAFLGRPTEYILTLCFKDDKDAVLCRLRWC